MSSGDSQLSVTICAWKWYSLNMVELYSHLKDPGSYCFTPQDARESRSPDQVDEAKEMMNHIFGEMGPCWGERCELCGSDCIST